jgi:peroxiredoxin
MRHLTVATLAALILAGSFAQAQSLSNRRAPSFSLPDSNLKQQDILDYRGKWLLLEFIQTDCASCKDIGKKLDAVKKKYPGKVEMLSLVLTPPATQQTVAQYVNETKITSPVLFDYGTVALSYFRPTPQNPNFDAPHVFAIDPQGNIVNDWSLGSLVRPEFIADLEKLVSAAPSSKAKGAPAKASKK